MRQRAALFISISISVFCRNLPAPDPATLIAESIAKGEPPSNVAAQIRELLPNDKEREFFTKLANATAIVAKRTEAKPGHVLAHVLDVANPYMFAVEPNNYWLRRAYEEAGYKTFRGQHGVGERKPSPEQVKAYKVFAKMMMPAYLASEPSGRSLSETLANLRHTQFHVKDPKTSATGPNFFAEEISQIVHSGLSTGDSRRFAEMWNAMMRAPGGDPIRKVLTNQKAAEYLLRGFADFGDMDKGNESILGFDPVKLLNQARNAGLNPSVVLDEAVHQMHQLVGDQRLNASAGLSRYLSEVQGLRPGRDFVPSPDRQKLMSLFVGSNACPLGHRRTAQAIPGRRR